MATLVVSIICIAMIVTGGVILTQGMLNSADVTAGSVAGICVMEGELARTSLDACRAEYLSWSDLLRVTVRNTGQVKLARFDEWDLFLAYEDNAGESLSAWLPCTTGTPGENEWQNAGIGLDGPVEFFEPGILNPGEQVMILANPAPSAGANTTGVVNIASPNGVYDTASFWNPGYSLLVPHTENVKLATVSYYELAASSSADSGGTIMENAFSGNETGRKILVNQAEASREARHLFSLNGISVIPATTWTVSYRCMTDGDGAFPLATGNCRFDIDINIRSADGTLRETIATGVASAAFPVDDQGTWITMSGSYEFPGFAVTEETDYLEIVFYGTVAGDGPAGSYGYMRVLIDDVSLGLADQTRIEA